MQSFTTNISIYFSLTQTYSPTQKVLTKLHRMMPVQATQMGFTKITFTHDLYSTVLKTR